MIKLTKLIKPVYEYGCVMAQIHPHHAGKILDFNNKIIGENILYTEEGENYGRESDPHVTIKYGLTENYDENYMRECLKEIKPFDILVGKMDIFENEKFDVVKFNVDGKKLREIRKIFDCLPNEDKYPEYNPHMTLAYVQKGQGRKYKNKSSGKLAKVKIEQICYSNKGKKYYIDL